MGEFHIDLGIGNVAAGGNVEVMQLDAAGKLGQGMAAILLLAPIPAVGRLERQARENGDAVVALHAAQMDLAIAQRPDRLEGKILRLGLHLLQADDVGLPFAREPREGIQTLADGIDVPADDAHHAIFRLCFNMLIVSMITGPQV